MNSVAASKEMQMYTSQWNESWRIRITHVIAITARFAAKTKIN